MVAADPKKPFITGFDECDRVGGGLAAAAASLLDGAQRKVDGPLDMVTASVSLPLRKVTGEERRRSEEILSVRDDSKLQFHGIDPRTEALGVLKLAGCPGGKADTILQAVRIGDICIAALPGEVFVQYGLKIIKDSPFKDTFVIGLANDYAGYIPTRDAFDKGGYEIKSTFRTGMYGRSAGKIITKAMNGMIDSLYKRR
jgi:hypothetical protein